MITNLQEIRDQQISQGKGTAAKKRNKARTKETTKTKQRNHAPLPPKPLNTIPARTSSIGTASNDVWQKLTSIHRASA
jgi:hypothetical protein